MCGIFKGLTMKHSFRMLIAIVPILSASVANIEKGWADDVNFSGQGQQTPGSAPAHPANPAQNDGPSYPGDQPQKQGMDPSSQVHNLDKNDLSGKKHKESEGTN
jgi:hypothetical protein